MSSLAKGGIKFHPSPAARVHSRDVGIAARVDSGMVPVNPLSIGVVKMLDTKYASSRLCSKSETRRRPFAGP